MFSIYFRKSILSINKYSMNRSVEEAFGDERLLPNKFHSIKRSVDFPIIVRMTLEA